MSTVPCRPHETRWRVHDGDPWAHPALGYVAVMLRRITESTAEKAWA